MKGEHRVVLLVEQVCVKFCFLYTTCSNSAENEHFGYFISIQCIVGGSGVNCNDFTNCNDFSIIS